jgi:hypothetical protein
VDRLRFQTYGPGLEGPGQPGQRAGARERPSLSGEKPSGWSFMVVSGADGCRARDARSSGRGLLAAHQGEGVELYPKQDQIADGPASLIRMPSGVHRLTGRGNVLAV